MRQTHHPHQNTHLLTLRLPSRRLNRKPIFTPITHSSALCFLTSLPRILHSASFSPNIIHSPSENPLDRLTNHHPILVFLVLYHVAIELHYLHQRAFVEGLLIRWFAELACG